MATVESYETRAASRISLDEGNICSLNMCQAPLAAMGLPGSMMLISGHKTEEDCVGLSVSGRGIGSGSKLCHCTSPLPGPILPLVCPPPISAFPTLPHPPKVLTTDILCNVFSVLSLHQCRDFVLF